MGTIVLGTSIAPFNIEKQKLAVESWLKNGFKVISCNVREEIEILQEEFQYDGLEFVEINKTAVELVGKKLPYINDILCKTSQLSDAVCGFINSDIIFCDFPEGMYEWIESEGRNSLLFTHRNEINEVQDIYDLNWTIHFDGIDLFFMDKELVDGYFDDNFFVQSAWDMVILPKCVYKGIAIKEITNPIAFHKKHAQKWSFETSKRIISEFGRKYFSLCQNEYETLSRMYYTILYKNVEQICFEMAGGCDENDFVFEINDLSNLRPGFKKTAAYIMNYFNCNCLVINNFIVSKESNESYFNELNRSMQLLYKVNGKYSLFNKVYRKSVHSDMEKVIALPISYLEIDIDKDESVDRIFLNGDTYIMPAGIRGCEWYNCIGKKLESTNIVGFIDNSTDKAGTEIENLMIYATNEIISKEKEFNVVIASKYYGTEIIEQMSEHIPEERLFNASCILGIDECGRVIYFRPDKLLVK